MFDLKKNVLFFKYAAVILILPLLFLGCSKKTAREAPDISGSYTYNVKLNYDKNHMEGKISHTKEAGYVFSVTSPDELSGMVFEFNGEEFHINYLGLTKTFDVLPEGSVMDLLFSMLNDAAKADALTYSKSENGVEYFKGMYQSGEYEIGFNQSDGKICSLSLGSNFKAQLFFEDQSKD